MSESTRIPGYVCRRLPVASLVTSRLLDHDHGVRRGGVDVADPTDPARNVREPVEVTVAGPGTAAAAIGGQVVALKGRPGLNGRRFWEFACPLCGKACRVLHSPVGVLPYRCRSCWRIARPSRSPTGVASLPRKSRGRSSLR